MSLKGSEVRFRAAKKRQKCRLRVPTGGFGRQKRAKVSPEGSDGRCLAAKKAKSVTEEFRSGCMAAKKAESDAVE